MEINHPLKITVMSSKCDHYKPGDVIYMNGPLIDRKKTGDLELCVTALSALYNFIYAIRKGATGEELGFPDQTFQCPDIPEEVFFKIEVDD